MLNVSELKDRAKAAFKKNYGLSVFAALILYIVSGEILSSSSSTTARNSSVTNPVEFETLADQLFAILPLVVGIVIIFFLLFLLIDVFLLTPIYVGGIRFFLENASITPSLSTLGFAFKNHYFKIVITMFLKELFVTLWSFLLIIPGIYKGYCYWLVPFLLAENPDKSPLDVLHISSTMMDGYKLKALWLDISFVGWAILKIITLGLSEVLYSGPYYYATKTEFYLALKEVNPYYFEEKSEEF